MLYAFCLTAVKGRPVCSAISLALPRGKGLLSEPGIQRFSPVLYLGRRFIAGEGFEPTTLLSPLDNTVFFFLCVLVAKVETVILS